MSLTQPEVDALKTGDRVVVTWSGGNGPHVYVVERDKFGQVWACVSYSSEMWRSLHRVARLDPVGEHPLTTVRMYGSDPSDP